MPLRARCLLLFYILTLSGCESNHPYFTALSPQRSSIDFENTIEESTALNIMTYEYMYNGGGVAIADVNNDGLPDIFFTANSGPCKLYLNQGHLHFRDITELAGIDDKPGWKTGVTMCDVNNDGLPDIYVCYSGNGPAEERSNRLFVNQGVKDGIPAFKEMAAAYGIDARGCNSTQAAFLDYDHDGDLDMVLINHATMFYSPFFNTTKLRNKRHPYFSSRFYRNDSHGDTVRFTDVSQEVGIKGGGNNFNLGIAISDVNNDGWPDMYVTNDYEEQDFLYINQRNGTFRDATHQSLGHLSKNGMGVDIADYNNDGLTDIIELDMLPEDNHRQKLLKGPDEYDKYQLLVDSGYYHQNMRNTLQLNTGVRPDGSPVFSEIGQLAGISATDWSWSPLLADFDNDGLKDLYISNGFLHDFTNMDFLKFTVAEAKEKYGSHIPVDELVSKMPSTRISNYLFRNNGDLTFANVTKDWGMERPSITNGAAYADLDNDGDLDLVLNTLNGKAVIWENHASELTSNHYLTLELKGAWPNLFAVGAKVALQNANGRQYQELYPTRGFQSSMDNRLHFGLGKYALVDRLTVQWPSGRISELKNIKADQILSLNEKDSRPDTVALRDSLPAFQDITATSGIDFVQKQYKYVDFKQERLLPYQLSVQGPRLFKADVNKDGLEDVYVGGSYKQPGVLYLQTREGTFRRAPSQPWAADGDHADMGACFFDANNDGYPDLYIAMGGNDRTITSEERRDRLYLSDGKGNFTEVTNALPPMDGTRSCITAFDLDKDGDMDLFVGGFVQPGSFPLAGNCHLLRNDSRGGKIFFTDITSAVVPGVGAAVPGVGAAAAGSSAVAAGMNIGLTTDVISADINKDGWPDILIVGQWMPIKLFLNEKGTLKDASSAYGLDSTGGLWTRIFPVDINNDGEMDYVLGNLAPNTSFTASKKKPMSLYAGDFDGNGSIDPIVCYYIQDNCYPYLSLDEITSQIPSLKKKYLRYENYADATPSSIFGEEALKRSKRLDVQELRNMVLINDRHKRFHSEPLPIEAQFSALFGMTEEDIDGDGKKDLLLCGNFYPFRVQTGREDAGKGLVLKGDGKGNYTPLLYHNTGVLIEGDVRDLLTVTTAKKEHLYIIAKNGDSVQVLRRTTAALRR